MIRVEFLAQRIQIRAELRSAQPKRLASGILIKPKLIILPQLGKASQVIEHRHPSAWAAPKAVDHQHRNATWIERLEHEYAAKALRFVGIEQACGGWSFSLELLAVQEISQRGAEIGLHRNESISKLQVACGQRIMQLKHAVMAMHGTTAGAVPGRTTRSTAVTEKLSPSG